MYMGVILETYLCIYRRLSVPHVYGGDPSMAETIAKNEIVFPMYMGVILQFYININNSVCVPHVYGGDPNLRGLPQPRTQCSPCIWG